MSPSAFASFLALVYLISLSAARIVSISAPTSVKAGKKFNVVIGTEDYIQNWSDYFIVFGVRNSSLTPCDTCLGTPLNSYDLFTQGHYNTGSGNFTESLDIKSAGSYTLTAAITSVFGASEEAAVSFANTTIQVN
ncbi:hypothetical protein FRB96_005350 [Tulasnella sp. 330]|nr:hypothetical protein FRB96_005350 [Tulasnella sp. 330]KAG8875795.1 hypothetical protein FRB97_004713 [Tulasnella sp. 331]KAG8881643.1 hypothetical protein FRB98_004216 [Tulasnella sp. 332]